MFNRRQLRGHKKAVLSLDASYEGSGGRNLIVSGSEDSTARIWDVRTNRAVKCVAGCFNNNPVDSVLFAVKSAGVLYLKCISMTMSLCNPLQTNTFFFSRHAHCRPATDGATLCQWPECNVVRPP